MTRESVTRHRVPPAPDGQGVRTHYEVVRKRRRGEYVAAVVLLLLVAWFLQSALTNENFQWGEVANHFFDRRVLGGLLVTLELTVIATVMAIVLGIVLAEMRLARNRVLNAVSWVYAWFIRGMPVMVMLVLMYNLGALYPRISVGLPFMEPFFSVDSNRVITSWTAAIIGLGLHAAGNMAEIFRAGILSVDRGQVEAGTALGMPRSLVRRRIVLPQALRAITPPTGNLVIGMLLMSAIVSFVSLNDLLFSVQAIYALTYQPIPLLLVASFWYLLLTSALMTGQYFLERRISRSERARGNGRVVADRSRLRALFRAPRMGG